MGVRGSLPTPMSTPQLRQLQHKLLSEATPEDIASEQAIEDYLDRSPLSKTFGGDTSCVSLSWDNNVLILDAGSGIRGLSNKLFANEVVTSSNIHMLFSHFHWDHICGLPFFGPIYHPQAHIHIHSWREDARDLLEGQMSGAYFPVKWPNLPSTRDFFISTLKPLTT